MPRTRWDERFFSSTRGRIIGFLRRASRTVDELAVALDLTDNAVRSHLATLERDGLVQQKGVRRGAGKPAYSYALTPEADLLFPNPYGPVLAHLLDVLGERMAPDGLEGVMRAVGLRLAANQPPAQGDLRSRLDVAVGALNELGGLAEVEEREGHWFLRGYSCPFALAAVGHPEVCALAEVLLAHIVGAQVHECCTRNGQPYCCFEVIANERHGVPAEQP